MKLLFPRYLFDYNTLALTSTNQASFLEYPQEEKATLETVKCHFIFQSTFSSNSSICKVCVPKDTQEISKSEMPQYPAAGQKPADPEQSPSSQGSAVHPGAGPCPWPRLCQVLSSRRNSYFSAKQHCKGEGASSKGRVCTDLTLHTQALLVSFLLNPA